MKAIPIALLFILCGQLYAQQRPKLEYTWQHNYLFDDITYFNKKGVAFAKVGEYWGAIDSNAVWMVKPEESRWAEVGRGDIHTTWRAVRVDSLWGFVDGNAKLRIPCQYHFCNEDDAIGTMGWVGVQNASGKWGGIDTTGKLIVGYYYTKIGNSTNGNFVEAMNEAGKWGVLNKAGKEVVPFIYDIIPQFYYNEISKTGLIKVVKTGIGIGLVDTTGREVVPCKYADIYRFSEGLAAVQNREGNWGFIDKTGKELVPPIYKKVNDFREGRAAVQEATYDRWGFIDKTGKVVVDIHYYKVENFSEGLAAVYNYPARPIKNEKGEWEYPSLPPKYRADWGFVDANGNIAIPHQYNEAISFENGMARVQPQYKGAWAIINKKGKEIIPSDWGLSKFGDFVDDHRIIAEKQGYKGLLDCKSKEWLIPARHDYLMRFSYYTPKSIFVFGNGKKQGYCDSLGNIIRAAAFDQAMPFFYGRACVETEGKWSAIKEDGSDLLQAKYKTMYPAFEGVFLAMDAQKQTLINAQGALLVDSIHLDLLSNRATEGRIAVSDFVPTDNGLWGLKSGFIDSTGKLAVALKYDGLGKDGFNEGLAVVYLDNKYGYINKTGEEVIPPKYLNAHIFSDGLAFVLSQDRKMLIVDKQGVEAEPANSYKNFWNFKEGRAAVQNQEDKLGFIDKTGVEIIACQYQNLKSFSEGLAAVQNADGHWGFIDRKGRAIVACQYKDVLTFKEGLAAVQNAQEQWGFINKTGKMVIPCQYLGGNYFSEGRVLMYDKSDKVHILDTLGRLVKELPPYSYAPSHRYQHGLVAIQLLGNNNGLLDKNGEWVLPPIYQEIGQYIAKEKRIWSEGLAPIRFNNLWGFVDTLGRVLVEPQFTSVSEFLGGVAYVEKVGMQAILRRPKPIIAANEAAQIKMIWTLPKLCITNCNSLDYYDDIIKIELHLESPSPIDTAQTQFKIRFINSKGEEILLQEQGSKSSKAKLRVFPKKDNQNDAYEFDYENELVLKGLPADKYRLQVVVEQNGLQYQSLPFPIDYQPRQPSLHLLSVGIPEGLRYSVNDAHDFAGAVHGNNYYQKTHLHILPDPKLTEAKDIIIATTKEYILHKLRSLAKQYKEGLIKEHDVLMLFFSAHGDVVESSTGTDFCIRPYGYVAEDKETGLRVREIMDALAAINCKKILFLDACHSGLAQTKGTDEKSRAKSLSQLNAWKSGWLIFTSSSGEESFEHESWRNGAFTEAILEALSGKADNTDRNGLISVEELDTYLKFRIPQMIQALNKDYRSQQPQLFLPETAGFNLKTDIFQVRK